MKNYDHFTQKQIDNDEGFYLNLKSNGVTHTRFATVTFRGDAPDTCGSENATRKIYRMARR
jgi:hypothetical protein